MDPSDLPAFRDGAVPVKSLPKLTVKPSVAKLAEQDGQKLRRLEASIRAQQAKA